MKTSVSKTVSELKELSLRFDEGDFSLEEGLKVLKNSSGKYKKLIKVFMKSKGEVLIFKNAGKGFELEPFAEE